MKRYAVFYRTYSLALEDYVTADSALSFAKDGPQAYLNHKVPRISVFVDSTGDAAADKNRLKDLEAFLAGLVKQGLLVAFNS